MAVSQPLCRFRRLINTVQLCTSSTRQHAPIFSHKHLPRHPDISHPRITQSSIPQTVRHMASSHRTTETASKNDSVTKCPVSHSSTPQLNEDVGAKSIEDKQQNALPFTDIPGPPGPAQWPVIGTLMLFKPFSRFSTDSVKEMVEDLFERYGPLVRCQLMNPTVLVRDLKDMETVYRNEGIYPDRPALQLQLQYVRRNNIKPGFNEVKGEEWYKLRAPLTKRMARVNSATYYMVNQDEVANDFTDILANRNDFSPEEISDIFFRYATESIGVVCFNTRLGFLTPECMDDEDKVEFLRASKEMFIRLHEEVCGKSIMHRFYRNKTYREYERAQLILKRYADAETKKSHIKLKELQASGEFDPDSPNLLYSLLADPSLDIEDVSNIMNTLYITGTDSTAKNLQTLFYNLATNPEKQDKLYDEIMNVIGPDQPLTPEALSQMPYLYAAVRESFRLYVPITGLPRYLPRDVVLSGYNIPAGTQVFVYSTAIGKDIFPEPDKYLPERWLRSYEGRQRKHHTHPMAVMPFGYGPRNCIGRRFAEQEIYLAATKIVQKLRIGIKPESENMTFHYSIFIEPDRPIAFTFTRR